MPTSDAAAPILGIGETAAALAEALATGHLLVAATDEPRAEGIAHALAALVPDATVLFCPGSDALPGDEAPASPVNVGQRVAALRRVRLCLADQGCGPIALITTGEALARAYPPPQAFAAAPPRVEPGAAIDGPTLLAELEGLGYVADERVDEPGEIAWRGQVLDVFPADADRPLRIEIADGTITGVRAFDPADQRSIADCGARELGRVAEPSLGDDRATLLDHLPGARVVIEPAAEERRRRFLDLAADAAKRRPKRAARDTLAEAAWTKALADRDLISLARAGDPPPRFVEGRNPLRAFAKAARAAIEAGTRIALLGSARDLRFLSRRVAKAIGTEVTPVDSWTAAAEAKKGSLVALPAAIDRGFVRDGIFAVAAADLLGSRAERDDAGPTRNDTALFDLGEIRVGDVVVHEDHGIGVVEGLEAVDAVGVTEGGDAIRIGYAKDDHRLVPVADADRLWRYGAEADAVTLDRLDGSSWSKRRL